MSRKHSRSLCLLTVSVLCLAILMSTPAIAAKYAGHQAETTMPFRSGEAVPELDGPFLYQVMDTRIGEPDKKGKQRIKLVFDAKNMTNRDYVVRLTAVLLNEQGETVALRTVKKKIDDEEREHVRLRFRKLTTAQVESIKEIRIKIAYEND